MKNKKNQNIYRYTFNKNDVIGLPAAESERDFNKLFLNTANYEALADVTNPKCILIGRTGIGKSALIRQLEENEAKVKRISPEEMSIRFLSNSTILDYLRGIGVNLNFFYKILWKHVFIVELINLYVGDNEQKRMSFLERIKEGLTGAQKGKKQKAVAYLQEFSNDFWEETEIRIKSFENTLESSLSKELGLQSNFFKSSVAEIKKNIDKEQSEVKYKAEQIINQLQAEKLFEIIKIFKEDIFFDYQKRYFIIIDDLDTDWVSEQIVYDLIAAMVEVVQEYQNQFKGVKIILSLRDNLYKLTISDNEHRGGQREKFAALDLHISWSEEELIQLLDIRLKHFSSSKISIDNLFEKEYKKDGIKYILERTYMRPRALISFTNKIIEQVDKKSHFTKNAVKIAEPSYSLERMYAIDDEWSENYGHLSKICNFLNGTHINRPIDSVLENSFEFVYLKDGFQNQFKGKLFDICNEYKNDKLSFEEFRKELFFILFLVGIIGIKMPDKSLCFYYDKLETFGKEDFTTPAKFSVHKALFSYFKVNNREQEIDQFN